MISEDQWAKLLSESHQLLGLPGSKVRFLAGSEDEANVRVDVEVDGFVLEDKLQLERLLKNRLAADLENRKLLVNFKRPSSLAREPGPHPGGPSIIPKAAAPYGLKIEKRAIPKVRDVIVVASGKGGVGKSTVSANLAVALHRLGKRVGLLDADIYGPSASLMFGVHGPLAVNEHNRLTPKLAHGVKIVSFGFMSDAKNPVIWRGPLVAKAISQFCYDVDWGELDYLIVDLPPGTGDIQITLIEKIPIHGAIIVTTPQDVALIDAHKAISMFEKLQVPIVGVVENMSSHVCTNCGHEEHLFGQGIDDFARLRQLKILARIPLRSRIRADADAGNPTAGDNDRPEAQAFYDIARSLN